MVLFSDSPSWPRQGRSNCLPEGVKEVVTELIFRGWIEFPQVQSREKAFLAENSMCKSNRGINWPGEFGEQREFLSLEHRSCNDGVWRRRLDLAELRLERHVYKALYPILRIGWFVMFFLFASWSVPLSMPEAILDRSMKSWLMGILGICSFMGTGSQIVPQLLLCGRRPNNHGVNYWEIRKTWPLTLGSTEGSEK